MRGTTRIPFPFVLLQFTESDCLTFHYALPTPLAYIDPAGLPQSIPRLSDTYGRQLTMPTTNLQLHQIDLNFSLDDLPSLSSAQLALVHFNINVTELHRAHAELLFMQRRAKWLEDERERLRVEQETRIRVKEEKVDEEILEPPSVVKKKVVEEITLDDTDDDEELTVVSTRKGKGKEKEVIPAKKVKKGTKRKSDQADLQPRPQIPKRTSSARSNSNDTTSAPPNPLPLPNRLAKLPSFKRTNRTSQPSEPILDPLPPDKPPVATKIAERSHPVFIPNHSATLAHELPSFLREDSTKDSQGRFVFRPPPPGPFFTPLSSTADEDPDGKAPSELVKQLTTLIFPNLDSTVTPHLLLLFLARNQPRLPPRPIALRREYGSILVAFKSHDDALQTIEMASGKQLPWVDDEDLRTLEPELYTTWLEENEEPGYIEARQERAQELGQEWTPVDWKWGELSDEVRRDWRKYQQLPRARVMPRLDLPSGVFVSEEYKEEVEILTNPESLDEEYITRTREKREKLSKVKIEIYGERVKAWNDWYDMNRTSKDFTTRPPIPAYPSDDVCQKRLDEIAEKELRKAEEILRELEARRLEEEAELCRRHLKRNTDLTRLLKLDPRYAFGTASSRLIKQLNTRPLEASHHQPITPPSPITPRAPVNSPQLTIAEERIQARREAATKTLAKLGLLA